MRVSIKRPKWKYRHPPFFTSPRYTTLLLQQTLVSALINWEKGTEVFVLHQLERQHTPEQQEWQSQAPSLRTQLSVSASSPGSSDLWASVLYPDLFYAFISKMYILRYQESLRGGGGGAGTLKKFPIHINSGVFFVFWGFLLCSTPV